MTSIQTFFEAHPAVAVAFSGGVDSAVLLLLAKRYAQRVKAYFVKSQFQPQFERDDALRLAALLHLEIEILHKDILSFPEVVKNPANRCYYCKQQIFKAITAAARADGFTVLLDGTNASDDVAERPGFRALQELSVLSPLRLCGYTKAEIRQIARDNALPVADKPSYACLATRIPTGTAITAEALHITERAENELRALGFQNFRVRYRGGAAKLELGAAEFERLYEKRERVVALLSKYYDQVLLDLKERNDE